MKVTDHKLTGEGPHHYELESPDGVRFKVAKHLIDLAGHVAISKLPKTKAFANGGQVDDPQPDGDDPDAEFVPGMQPVPVTGTNEKPARHYDDGGFTIPSLNNPVGLDAPSEGAMPLADSPVAEMAQSNLPENRGNPADVATSPALPYAPPQPAVAPVPNATPDGQLPQTATPPDQTPPPDPVTGVPPPTPGIDIGSYLKAHDQAFGALERANNDRAAAQAKISDAEAAAYDQEANHLKQLDDNTAVKNAAFDKTSADLRDKIAAGKTDPNHYINSLSTGGKIVAVIAAALGGGGAALAGQPNLAMKVITDNIDRDIQAQKDNLETTKGLLRTNLEQQHDMNAAAALTRSQMIAATQGQVAAAAARQGGAIAKANADALNANLEIPRQQSSLQAAQQSAIWNYKQSALQSGLPGGRAGNGPDGFDYQKFNTLMQLGSPEEKKALMEERTKWEQANKEQADIKDAFGRIQHASDYLTNTPGPDFRESTKQVRALGESTLNKYARDTDGRVTPESVEMARPMLPRGSAVDTPATYTTKLNQMLDMAKRGQNFPTLETNGIIRPIRSSAQVRQGDR
jgi:hypothetical protein